jgi:hypothetical protein
MRKEITKTLKDEIELRRKVKIHDDDFDPEKDLDLNTIAKSIDKLNKKRDKVKECIDKNLEHNIEEEAIEDGIEIPGINAPIS